MPWSKAWHHHGRRALAASAAACTWPCSAAPGIAASSAQREQSSEKAGLSGASCERVRDSHGRRWQPLQSVVVHNHALSAVRCTSDPSTAPAEPPPGVYRSLKKRISDRFRRADPQQQAKDPDTSDVSQDTSEKPLRFKKHISDKFRRTDQDIHQAERQVGTGPLTVGARSSRREQHRANVASVGDKSLERTKLRISRADLIRNSRRFCSSFEETYKVCGALGHGGFGQVYKVEHRYTGTRRAMKEVSKASVMDWNLFMSEVENLIELDHPHIIRLIEFFEDDVHAKMVFELCSGPDLLDRVEEFRMGNGVTNEGRVPVPEVAALMRQMLRAVHGCHSHGIIHRDLKPEHFMVMDKEKQGVHSSLKLIDLGLSEHREQSTKAPLTVTLPYAAPEVLEGSYDNRCDVWSLGTIFYLLLTSEPLFSLWEEDDFVVADILDEAYVPKKLSKLENVADDARDLLTRMLMRNPVDRITIQSAMEHPFLQNAVRKEFDPEFYEKMLAFTRMPSLKRLALLQVAHLSKDAETELQRRTFRKINAKGDGELSCNELQIFLGKRRGVEFLIERRDELLQVLCDIDHKGEGSIRYFEFLAATLPSHLYLQGNCLRLAFNSLDANSDGCIDVEDLQTFFNFRLTVEELATIMKEVDPRGKGVDYSEFCRMMEAPC